MAKTTTKTAKSKAAPKPAKAVAALMATTDTKPKTAAKPKAAAAPKTVAKPKTAAKPKAAAKPPAKTVAKPKAPAKPKAKPAKPEAGLIKQTTDAIAQLASDILADRIVPTIEQIKAIAASALSQDQTKGKRAKKTKKK